MQRMRRCQQHQRQHLAYVHRIKTECEKTKPETGRFLILPFPSDQNIFRQPTTYFGDHPLRGRQGRGRFLILGIYLPPATKIFSAIEKSIFEFYFSHSQKYFCPATKIFWEKQKATTPSATQTWSPGERSLFDFGNLLFPSHQNIFRHRKIHFGKIDFRKWFFP